MITIIMNFILGILFSLAPIFIFRLSGSIGDADLALILGWGITILGTLYLARVTWMKDKNKALAIGILLSLVISLPAISMLNIVRTPFVREHSKTTKTRL